VSDLAGEEPETRWDRQRHVWFEQSSPATSPAVGQHHLATDLHPEARSPPIVVRGGSQRHRQQRGLFAVDFLRTVWTDGGEQWCIEGRRPTVSCRPFEHLGWGFGPLDQGEVDGSLWHRCLPGPADDRFGDSMARTQRQSEGQARIAEDDGDRVGSVGADPEFERQVNVIRVALPGPDDHVSRGLLMEESPVLRARRVHHLDPAGEVTGQLGQDVLRPVGRRYLVHGGADALLAQDVTHLVHEAGSGDDHGRRA
jgi:hypothetical protein